MDPDFPERVFDYNSLIKHVYGRPVASFAILADDEPGWRPGLTRMISGAVEASSTSQW